MKGKYECYLPRTKLSFGSHRNLREYVYTIIEQDDEYINKVIEEDDGYVHRFLLDMIHRHPDIVDKLKGVADSDIKFMITENRKNIDSTKKERYRAYYYIDTWKAFSLFVKCTKGRENTDMENIIRAFLDSVEYQIDAFKIRNGSVCECGENAKHIAHDYPIDTMVYDFMSKEGLSSEDITYIVVDKQPCIADNDIDKKFCRFFKKKHRMSYLCPYCYELWRVGLTEDIEERARIHQELMADMRYVENPNWTDEDDESSDSREEFEKRTDLVEPIQ